MHRGKVSTAGAAPAGSGLPPWSAQSSGAQERLATGGAPLRLGSGGDATPAGVQRLLSQYRWDADLVRDDLKSYVAEHLADADAVLVVDETGFLKKGDKDKSVGVQRQYSGTAGRIENRQVGVFLAYASARGRTLLDRELYLPQVWAEDWERRREAGVPESVSFHTKGQLAQLMLQRAVESGVSFAWVAGDEVYGNDRRLRLWLERLDVPHVLAIKSTENLWASTEQGPRQIRADRLVSQVDVAGWSTFSTGDGANQGLRLDHGENTASAGAGQRLLALGPPQHCQTCRVGLLRVLWPIENNLGGTGQGGRNPLGNRGML